MDETSIYNYKLLTEGIASSGQPTEDELGFIAGAGYKTVINLGLHNSDYAVSNEASYLKDNNIKYVHIPVIFDNPQSSDFDDFINALNQCKNSKTFIHCAANKRVSAFIALYRILVLGWATDKAIKELNTVWQPDDVWQSFINMQLARRLKQD